MPEFPHLSGALVFTLFETTAVIAAAVAGMILAANKSMDIIGAYALACINAFAGGTVRDLLLDNRPFYWMEHYLLLVVILALCIPFVYSARIFHLASEMHRRSVVIDAIGLALFTMTGTGIALHQGRPLIVAALMGVVTGTMGGVVRDVVVNEVPDLFRPGGLYATASFTGAIVLIAGIQYGMQYPEASALGIVVVVALRLLSLRLGVTVPAPQWAARGRAGEP